MGAAPLLLLGGLWAAGVAGSAPLDEVPRAPASRRSDLPPVLRFRETVDVVVPPPLDLEKVRAVWTRHWKLREHPGPSTGVPMHKDMLGVMSGTPPALRRVPESVLAILAVRGLKKLLRRDRMPPAERALEHSIEPPPAE
jgi:hypothetical protein